MTGPRKTCILSQLFLRRLKKWFLASKDEQIVAPIYSLYGRESRSLRVPSYAFRTL